MKNGMIKAFAVLILGSAVLTGCAIENQGPRGGSGYNKHHRYRHDNRYNNDRYDNHGHYYDNH